MSARAGNDANMDHIGVLSNMRNHGEYSDLTVICGDQQFKVHKAVVCSRSGWFKAACAGTRWKEGQDGIIELKAIDQDTEDEDYSCDDPVAVGLMLDYIYVGDYPATRWRSSYSDSVEEDYLVDAQPTTIVDGGIYYCGYAQDGPSCQCACHLPPPGDEPMLCAHCESFRSPGTMAAVEGSDLPPSMHARLHALAIKYDVVGLRSTAWAKFKQASQLKWDQGDFAKTVSIAFRGTPHEAEPSLKLKEMILEACQFGLRDHFASKSPAALGSWNEESPRDMNARMAALFGVKIHNY